jgi:hypothetical protein
MISLQNSNVAFHPVNDDVAFHPVNDGVSP